MIGAQPLILNYIINCTNFISADDESPSRLWAVTLFLISYSLGHGLVYLLNPGASTSWANRVISGSSSGKDSSVRRI